MKKLKPLFNYYYRNVHSIVFKFKFFVVSFHSRTVKTTTLRWSFWRKTFISSPNNFCYTTSQPNINTFHIYEKIIITQMKKKNCCSGISVSNIYVKWTEEKKGWTFRQKKLWQVQSPTNEWALLASGLVIGLSAIAWWVRFSPFKLTKKRDTNTPFDFESFFLLIPKKTHFTADRDYHHLSRTHKTIRHLFDWMAVTNYFGGNVWFFRLETRFFKCYR
jgi:hypothetical protein